MLKSLSVENYRGFQQKATLKFRPLTVLLGRNSSGKSSLTRLIPLLQQSLERQSSSPILWSSDTVDLGNISDVLTHNKTSSELQIGIKVSADKLLMFLSNFRYSAAVDLDQQGAEIEYIIKLSADGIRTRFNGIEIKYEDQNYLSNGIDPAK